MPLQKNHWSPHTFKDHHRHEHDACGIVACIEKEKIPTRKNITNCIDALIKMNHRAGFIHDEGDGAGIHIDLPRALWEDKLQQQGHAPALAHSPEFAVGHFFLTNETPSLKEKIIDSLSERGLDVLFQSDTTADLSALGINANKEKPIFFQVGCIARHKSVNLSKQLYELGILLENEENIHVASLSGEHAIYKVMGGGELLMNYYHDLKDEKISSAMTLGHNRYSTNTLSTFSRVQPFSLLGHNGEINTISKFREEAEMLQIPLVQSGSDSQDVNRVIETFICRDGFSLFEAMDMVFPPIMNEINHYPDHLQDLYIHFRENWGHIAQGPAGIVSRFGDEAVFSVDSLGLRPLWMLETDVSILFSSEPGILPNSCYVNDPKPLGPGEKIGLKWKNDRIEVFDHSAFQEEVFARYSSKKNVDGTYLKLQAGNFKKVISQTYPAEISNGQYNAFGWKREQIQMLEQMAERGVEPIKSLGHDAPLAAMDPDRKNISDFIKESVAVVTNPAIDREREAEHFSLSVFLGFRPSIDGKEENQNSMHLASPLLIEGTAGWECYEKMNHPSYDQVVDSFLDKKDTHHLSLTVEDNETLSHALKRVSSEAVEAVNSGKSLLILDDAAAHSENHLWMDPHLALSAIQRKLTEKGMRRNCSLLLRSASIRSLHDIMLAMGLGADAISPYYMFLTVYEESIQPVLHLFEALNKGMEKALSTIGIHELKGYGRLFSAIGLHEDAADLLNITSFLGSDKVPYDFTAMKEDAIQRRMDYQDENQRLQKEFHFFPRIWKAIGEVASTGDYTSYREKLEEMEEKSPITIRHLTKLKEGSKKPEPSSVDIGVGSHSLPFVIASMSFGSQNETAFRAYAEAAERLNMISLNGEGGEIKDMIGKYPHTRGQQIASGRFGVNMELLNSSNLLEIKIGQGAKPGEGGHLPGSKVTEKIAEARNASIGSDLISPSNNHDIYSIEDLAQMIDELKTANPSARIAVKVPVVPNIGTIAVGIAKAGADIITLSGFDGGTGAARIHALQHVGLPVEIGVKAAHNALLEAGLRDYVEIWADGGIKSAMDVLKIMLLGANRIGFGTLSMIAIGCTTCRGCHLDTCHVGIATQIDSEAQAKEHGLRRFVPRQLDLAVTGLMNLFTAFGEELKALTASLGFSSLQEIVGRSDLLVQSEGKNMLDLTYLLEVLEIEQMQKKSLSTISAVNDASIAVGAETYGHPVGSGTFHYQGITSNRRNLGSSHSQQAVLSSRKEARFPSSLKLDLTDGSIPGNGLGAYNANGVDIQVHGGAQDGTGKASLGGSIVILKSKGQNGKFINGSVGKGFGYGAQKGLLIAQGDADSRAGIRLSGADLIIGGLPKKTISADKRANISSFANIKGFAFEYMTNGRGVVLGDPGPWICAGMTGGVVYLRQDEDAGLTKETILQRIAKGAKVSIEPLSEKGISDLEELLSGYMEFLKQSGQHDEAVLVEGLMGDLQANFLQVIPAKEQADPSVSTE
ncbi:glutamate synthase-related protein [Falsibacillus pallidus]|uniref:glutamate synthase-related protein n=1 Tax=Falsibacillus pallidus TaxID=493781 RepID=UPI003D97B260